MGVLVRFLDELLIMGAERVGEQMHERTAPQNRPNAQTDFGLDYAGSAGVPLPPRAYFIRRDDLKSRPTRHCPGYSGRSSNIPTRFMLSMAARIPLPCIFGTLVIIASIWGGQLRAGRPAPRPRG